MFRREQRSGDAQGGTADDGPGVVSQVVSQVVKNAPAREAVAAGTAAIGRRSDGVVLERGSRRIPRRRKWSSDKNHRSKLGSGWRGWVASPARLVSLASATARKRRCMVSCCGVMMRYRSHGLLLACRLPAARVSAAGAQHAAPASLHDLQGSRKVRAPALGGLCARQNKRTRSEASSEHFEALESCTLHD